MNDVLHNSIWHYLYTGHTRYNSWPLNTLLILLCDVFYVNYVLPVTQVWSEGYGFLFLATLDVALVEGVS